LSLSKPLEFDDRIADLPLGYPFLASSSGERLRGRRISKVAVAFRKERSPGTESKLLAGT
jgi:hypothetical protein